MPELPEVETLRRDLEPALVGKRILDVAPRRSRRYGDLRSAIGAKISVTVRPRAC